jgi:hypothetical protein
LEAAYSVRTLKTFLVAVIWDTLEAENSTLWGFYIKQYATADPIQTHVAFSSLTREICENGNAGFFHWI